MDYSSACPSNPRETLNNIVLVPVLKQKFVLLVSKNHELSRYESIRISQALNYPFIKYTDNTSLDDYVKSLFVCGFIWSFFIIAMYIVLL